MDSRGFWGYGVTFGPGDVIGCYLDLTTDQAIIQFTVNGVEQGIAFTVDKAELGGQALFPHVATKNLEFTVNFGQIPGSFYPLIPGY